MAKSFKKYRNRFDDSDWDDGYDDYVSKKEQRMEMRRNRKKEKANEKYAALDERDFDE